MIIEDLKTKKYGDAVIQTRFPPEPNGYLHIGHAKAICLDFDLADEFGGLTNLRFDDTNPEKEEQEYVDSIQEDVRWLGFQWDRLCYASDYFDQLYEWAVQLVRAGMAYVDDLTAEEIRAPSRHPHRTRAEQSLPRPQHRGESRPVGAHAPGRVCRRHPRAARQNRHGLAQPQHARPGHVPHPPRRRITAPAAKWCIYPMYDFAHGQSDSIERVTHSMCTLEFTDHQPLYKWYIEQLGIFPSQQIEFDRLNLTYTLLSKRKLLQLVQEKRVHGWDDPRMPTISGIRRRGFTAEAIRNFCAAIGASRTNGSTDIEMLEHFQRDDLNKRVSARHGRAAPLENRHRQLSRRAGRVRRGGQQSRRRRRRSPPSAVLARALHRAGRLPRSASAQVLPSLAGQGSAPAQRLLHHRQNRGQGCRRQHHRRALHL